MNNYSKWVEEIEVDIDGEKEKFLWPKNDPSLWQEGYIGGLNIQSKDWNTSHKDKFFKYLRNRDVVIQAGGCCGLYPFLFSKPNNFKAVYTFEPHPLYFHCLVNNTQKNNVIKINAAIGATHGMITLKRPDYNPSAVGEHIVLDIYENAIPRFTIDDLMVKTCDLICLDVEGSEIDSLVGAATTISAFHPVITCENSNNKISRFLETAGYKLIDQSKMDSIYVVS